MGGVGRVPAGIGLGKRSVYSTVFDGSVLTFEITIIFILFSIFYDSALTRLDTTGRTNNRRLQLPHIFLATLYLIQLKACMFDENKHEFFGGKHIHT